MDLTITEIKHREKTVVLSIEGHLNAVMGRELKTKIKKLVAEKNIHLILDLAGVTLYDSSGLSAIVSGLKAAREQEGSLKLVGLSEKAKHLFELTRLARLFEFYQNVDEALKT